MQMPRPLLIAEIAGRDGAAGLRIVAPRDFKVGAWQRAETAALPAGFVPYCLDVAHQRSIHARAGEIRALRRAKLQYVYLRERATTLLSAPWERGRLTTGSTPPPIFVFSVGRCGSTMLFELARGAGLVSLSEPDFYTQAVAAHIFAGPLDPHYARLVKALRDLTDDLVAVCGNSAPAATLVKLRAQCCKAPAMIVTQGGTERPKSIFLIRRFEPWANSTLRASALEPPRVVERYMDGLRALRWLQHNTDCCVLRYEDLTADPAGALDALSRKLGLALDLHRTGVAAKRDAQLGTPLARDALKTRTADPRALAASIQLWARSKPGDLIAELELTDRL